MQYKCPKCGFTKIVKNGKVFGKQRYQCKKCCYQFTKMAPAGKPMFLKLAVHSLYLSGLSMREIAMLTGVTAQSVSRWIRKWHPAYMNEIGSKTKINAIQGNQLKQFLKISSEEQLLLMTTPLPSRAFFHTIIQLPKEKNKISLKKWHLFFSASFSDFFGIYRIIIFKKRGKKWKLKKLKAVVF